jgi:predicted nucleic acid-binding Zn ribbon protein
MTNAKVDPKEKDTDAVKSSLLDRERRRLRIMQIIFLVFCIVLILSLLLSMLMNI